MEIATRTAPSLSEAVAKEIRVLLVRRDMKQTELAARLGVTDMWLSRRLRGNLALDLNDLDRIATIFNVQVTDLLPRRSEGDLIATAGTRRDHGGELINVQSGSAVRPHLTGHTSRPGAHDASRRPARTRPLHSR